MSILVSMRVKVYDFEGTKKAAAKYAQKIRKSGCHWLKIYRGDNDPNYVLWLMEWENHAAFESLDNEIEDDINSLVNPVGGWEDLVWELSDAVALE